MSVEKYSRNSRKRAFYKISEYLFLKPFSFVKLKIKSYKELLKKISTKKRQKSPK